MPIKNKAAAVEAQGLHDRLLMQLLYEPKAPAEAHGEHAYAHAHDLPYPPTLIQHEADLRGLLLSDVELQADEAGQLQRDLAGIEAVLDVSERRVQHVLGLKGQLAQRGERNKLCVGRHSKLQIGLPAVEHQTLPHP